MSSSLMRILPGLILFALLGEPVCAQNPVSSPYAMFGIGDIDYRDYGRTDGLGSTGIGLSSPKYLNNLNPASYSSLELKAFVFEISAREKTVTYRDNYNAAQYGSDLNFEKIAFGFRASRIWTTGAGIKPFSTVDYGVTTQNYVIGSPDIFTTINNGNGGLTNLYWVNALNIGKHLSAGISSSFLFGSINQSEQLQGGFSQDTLTALQTSFMRGVYLQGGLQYQNILNKHLAYRVGVVYSLKTNLRTDNNTLLEGSTGDTLKNLSAMIGNTTLPEYYGVGFSLISNDKLTLAGDYKSYRWSPLKIESSGTSLVNSSRYSMGIEYAIFTPNTNNYLERYVFQGGAYYENSYLKINNEQLTGYGLTLGVSFPNRDNTLYFNAGFEAGRRGTIGNGLIEENYFLLKLNIVIKSLWFIRLKNY
ncbi:MAG TPA: hypothetical protein VNE41_00955 [Chitinophagaceae bacterium]|nr:hypothetical protein [Chitinophagaceae bacterium]